MAMWKPRQNPWDAFLYWARRYFEEPNFDEEERVYKLAVAQLMADARTAFVNGESNWLERLNKAFKNSHNNLTPWREHDRYLKWLDSNPEDGVAGLNAVFEESAPTVQAIAGFLERTPRAAISTPGNRLSIGSVLRMAVEATQAPPYRPTPVQLALKLTGYGAQESDEVGRYRQALGLFAEVLRRGQTQGIAMRDLLDAQSLVWCVTTTNIPPHWPVEDREALAWYRQQAGQPEEEADATPALSTTADQPPVELASSLRALAQRLLIAEENLVEIAQLLEAKRQLVFYGPPGTGKTYVAKELAAVLAGDRSRVRIVQFHASYAYEDFVEGYRPRLHDGVPGFELVPGPLKRLAAMAREDPDRLHFLIIDEMNRGNVAKVLGELYFLLEYRDESVELQYSPESFSLPENLRIIGTMNTADRSIAVLDAALRRRFAFIPFFPDQEPIAGLLRRWLARNRDGMEWVADVVDAANRKLQDRNGAIGPSFFLRPGLDDASMALIWKHEILPYLEDHFIDAPERLVDFDLERLKKEGAEAQVLAGEDLEGDGDLAADRAE